MRRFFGRHRLSPSMVVAFVALLAALGGSSYAVVRLPARSVATQQLRNGAVTGSKIKPGAVTRAKIRNGAIDGSKVADDALTGADVQEASLGQVATAREAAHAAASDHASSAAALDKVSYRTAAGSVPQAASVDQSGSAAATATCDAGQHVAGGGVKVDDIDQTAVVDSFPDAGGSAWTAHVDNADVTSAHGFTVYAICLASGAAG
jgi:hypothetical protein